MLFRSHASWLLEAVGLETRSIAISDAEGRYELADVRSWLDAGATCVGLGSALVGATPPEAPGDLRALTERARRVVQLAGRR